ncbi:hypothetical protein POTOM_034618 [Populus tomentosa]|uniref:Uncharacterized protein n=1 Tax=Populus tomentosa TaxID=118781 RepID=A0A8X7Z5P0_POPTO|nr:hypothetical protein POTOM_034618 [Populus tomentosa]
MYPAMYTHIHSNDKAICNLREEVSMSMENKTRTTKKKMAESSLANIRPARSKPRAEPCDPSEGLGYLSLKVGGNASLWVQLLPLCCFFLLACADEVSRGGGTHTSWVSFGWLLSGGSGFSLDGLDRTVDLILHWILPITCMITMIQRLHRSMQIACICIYGMRDAFIQGVAFEGGNWLSLLVLRLK